MKTLSELMSEKHLTPAELDETRAPVAPTLDRKYIKGTPENKAYKASKKPRTGHPTNKVAEETELEEGKGYAPGWMLKKDKELGAKVKEKIDIAKKRQSTYGDKSAGKSVKEESEQLEENTPYWKKSSFNSRMSKIAKQERLAREKKEKEKKVAEDKDPCWDSHEMVGMKTKNGKKVPNCVPKNEDTEHLEEGYGRDPGKLDYDKNPTKSQVWARFMNIYDYEGYYSSNDDELEDLEKYVIRKFGQGELDKMLSAGYQNYFGRDYNPKKPHINPKNSQLGNNKTPNLSNNPSNIKKDGKLKKIVTSRVKDTIRGRLGRHTKANLPENTHLDEGTFKVDLEGLPPVFLDGESISDVRARLRTLVKRPADQIQDITRVQPVQMKRYFKDMMLGKDESAEVDEETIMEEEQEFSSMNVTPLRECLADVFAMYFMAHQFHWNVKGLDFIQYHNFLGELYEQLHEEVDTIAEQIRINGEGAPTSILELAELTNVDEATSVITNPHEMMIRLSDANDDVIISFYSALDVAEQAGNEGLINFLADRIDAHGKIGWMLTSSKE